MNDDFLPGFSGQSTEELVALEGDYRVDSIIIAFKEALEKKSQIRRLTWEENVVVAVETLNSEVNHGGFDHFFMYYNDWMPIIEDALSTIGSTQALSLTSQAIDRFGLGRSPTRDEAEERCYSDDEDLMQDLSKLDQPFFMLAGSLENKLFEFIKASRTRIDPRS